MGLNSYSQAKAESNIYMNHSAFKARILDLITAGNTREVRNTLAKAPDIPKFKDFEEYQFKMVNNGLRISREDVFVSILALAVNVGDYGMLDAVFHYLDKINVELGLQAKALNKPIINNRSKKQLMRRVSPLQYACSLGLFQMVDRLLAEGANPDGVGVSLRSETKRLNLVKKQIDNNNGEQSEEELAEPEKKTK